MHKTTENKVISRRESKNAIIKTNLPPRLDNIDLY